MEVQVTTTQYETKHETEQETKHGTGYAIRPQAGQSTRHRSAGARRRRTVGAATALTAAALAAALTGCASKNENVQPEAVSTASAASAVAQAQGASCPGTVPKTLASNVAGLSTKLQPLDATKVLLCVYLGRTAEVSSASPTPAAAASASTHLTLTDAAVISSLSDALNALGVPPTRPMSCPNDTGGSVLAIFTAGQQEVEVLITTSGCQQATNGQKTGWVGASNFAQVLAAALKG
jgi:hypothetical protein